jgi:hypothetical protein
MLVLIVHRGLSSTGQFCETLLLYYCLLIVFVNRCYLLYWFCKGVGQCGEIVKVVAIWV